MTRDVRAYAKSIVGRAASVQTSVTRRSFLGRLSASALALSLPAWSRLEASAQVADRQRFIGFFTPNGTVASRFFPEPSADLRLSPILSPLEPFKSKLLVLKGVNMDSTIGDGKPGGPHMKGPGAMLTGGTLLEGSFTGAGGPAGYADRISVDQMLANNIGQETLFPSLEFGVNIQGQEPLRVISYRGPNQPNQPIDDPWAMYDRVFSSFVPDDGSRARIIAERRSVLDYVKEELALLEARLPAEDRPRLEAHLNGVRNIERQFDVLGQVCELPQIGSAIDLYAKDNYPLIGRLQMDLMFQAHACDLTRVSTFMWSNADSWQYFPWIGVDEEHHELSHSAPEDQAAQDKLALINTWYSEQIAYFLSQLASVNEGDVTMLDNSLMLWGNEIGLGNTHTHENIPWVIAGSAGGQLSTGRFIDFGALPHNNLLLSVLHAFGMEAEVTFGAPENCTGPLPGLRV